MRREGPTDNSFEENVMSTYRIKPGDTLWALAVRNHTTVSALMRANPGIRDANLIYAGRTLNLPGSRDEFVPHAPHHAKPPAHHPAPPPGGQSWHPGSGQLAGADTSHWQSDATFRASVAGRQWTAIKATEGTGYTDPSFKSRWSFLGQKVKSGTMALRVAYHFLRPGNGAAQARHFLAALGIHGKLPAGTRLALDWEASALSDPKALRDAANTIHQITGLWPLVYCSASRVPAARAAVPNAPLWEAKWSGPAPTTVPFVQTSDGPGYDRDVFNGTLAALRRFAGF